MRRRSLLQAAAPALLALPVPLWAQARPIKLLVPFPPGGATDVVARLLAPGLARELGQPVIVDNRGGAGGSVGMAEVAKAAPDGLTLGMATVSTHGVNPAVYKKMPYDALRDFTPLAELVRAPGVLLVNNQVEARQYAQFSALVRSRPGKFSYGSPGIGSAGHMAMERFKAATGLYLVHIPYRGAAAMLNDLIGGQVEVGHDQVASALPHLQAGRLRALAVTWDQRLTQLPEVPTFAELNLPDCNEASWFGLVAPARLPEAQVLRINAAVRRVLQQPEVRAQCERLGLSATGSTPQAFATQVASTVERMRVAAKRAQISLDL